MSAVEYFRIALESLSQNKVRASLTMLGVIIGVMSVMLLVALGEAAQAFVQKEFADMGSNILIVTPGKQETTGMMPVVAGSYRDLTYADAKEIDRRAMGVRGVSPLVMGAGAVRYGDRRRDTMILAVTPDFETVRNLYVQVGRFVSENDVDRNNKVVILGTRVKEELFGDANPLNERIWINRTKHLVIGILESKGVTLGLDMDDLVLIPLTSGQQMFHGGEDKLFQIVISAISPEDVDVAAEAIRELLIARHDYQEDFTITDQTSMLSTFDKIFTALRVMLVGIASISLLVGGIGIMNIMLVSVRERTREVGIRKAVGARRWDIGMQFLVESTTLSSLGGCIGIALGFAGTFVIRAAYPDFPVYCSAWSTLTAFLFSLIVGVYFGVYPAVKASKVDPVEALRYE